MVDLQDNLRLESLIKTVLSETLDIAPDSMTLDTHLRDLGLDSIMMLNVTIELEDRLGVALTNLAMPANPRLRDIVAMIQRNHGDRT